jgi:hypothetical protein
MAEQGLYLSELDTLKKRWVEYFEQDPHFNPNLTMSTKGKIKIKS